MHISGEIARYWKRLTPILYLVKHQRLSKYYENDSLQYIYIYIYIYIYMHYMCLLTAKLVESSRI